MPALACPADCANALASPTGAFLLCGAALLAISYLFVASFPFRHVHITSRLTSPRMTFETVHLTSPPTSPPRPDRIAPPDLGVSAGSVQAALNAQHSADLRSLLVWFAVALGVMAVLSSCWMLMAGRLLRPLRQITATRSTFRGELHSGSPWRSE